METFDELKEVVREKLTNEISKAESSLSEFMSNNLCGDKKTHVLRNSKGEKIEIEAFMIFRSIVDSMVEEKTIDIIKGMLK